MNDVSASKGRTVAEQFGHINNVRLMWLKATAPELYDESGKFDKTHPFTKATLSAQLVSSGEVIEKLLLKGFTEGRIKNFKPHPMAFLGYLISHESHHRGQIILSLKQSGRKLENKVLFGL